AARKVATARQVLAAARAEFEDKGFEAASVRGIAARAGVAAGTVIHHYGEKRDLLHAALFEDLEEAIERALAQLDPAADLEGQLRALARAVFAYYERRPTLARTLLKESLFANAPWAARFAAQVARVHGAIAELARVAIGRGALRADVDPALLGVTWFSFFYFALIGWTQGELERPVDLIDRLTASHLRGLVPDESKARPATTTKSAPRGRRTR
ncbi:MAG: TetR/AcrR family transcriptional regulator, partial [Myxococcales bacterium]|nr:TetR/AcrR family transcriptional regulator [Myxococcales bacterium]